MEMNLSNALFTRTQQAVLALLFTQVTESYHLRGIIDRSGMGQGTVQRELKKLTEAGIILREKRGNQVFYRANKACPIFHELHRLVIKTFGIAEKLAQTLNPLMNRIQLAFIYGSFAQGQETSGSEIDLFIIGDLSFMDVVKVTRVFVEDIAREVNPTIFSVDEYEEKLNQRNHFLNSLQNSPKMFIIGNENEYRQLGK